MSRRREKRGVLGPKLVQIRSKSGPEQVRGEGSEADRAGGYVGLAGAALYEDQSLLEPDLGWKFLQRRTWSGKKLLPLQFPGLTLS